jgi:cytochrome P450
MQAIRAGTAPDDLATKIMTTVDPVTGQSFDEAEMVDQVAIFFLAGHETSASALAWALYLMATHPEWQDRLAAEAQVLDTCDFAVMSKLKLSRDVFREALRLYPPVPMMVRENTCPERFRDRDVKPGAQIVLSPWHLHRHERLWDNPDGFDPERWQTENGIKCQREAFIPFSAGTRVCTGAGFAMVEGQLILSRILRDYRVIALSDRVPVPVAHLTVRSDKGIWLRLERR